MFKPYSSSRSLVITSRWFATSRLAVPASVRLVYYSIEFKIYFVIDSNRIPIETHWDVLLRMLSKGLILFKWVLLTSTPNKAFYEDAVCDPEGARNNEAENKPTSLLNSQKTSHNTVTLHDLIRCFNHHPLNCLFKNLSKQTKEKSKLCFSGPLWGESTSTYNGKCFHVVTSSWYPCPPCMVHNILWWWD